MMVVKGCACEGTRAGSPLAAEVRGACIAIWLSLLRRRVRSRCQPGRTGDGLPSLRQRAVGAAGGRCAGHGRRDRAGRRTACPVPPSKPKVAKNKLWQKHTGAAETKSSPVEADLPQQVITSPAVDPLAPKSLPRSDVVDLSSDDEEAGFGPDASRRAERVVRDERQRRRAISNAVMLVGSIVILISAMAGLMWLSKK